MKKLISILILILIMSFVRAQDTISISWIEISEKSLDENLQLQLANKETEIAQAELLAARAMYLHNITASYSFMHTNNPLNAFGFKLNQMRNVIEVDNADLVRQSYGITVRK